MTQNADYQRLVAEAHARIEAEEGVCWHPIDSLTGYKECEAEVWIAAHIDGSGADE